MNTKIKWKLVKDPYVLITITKSSTVIQVFVLSCKNENTIDEISVTHILPMCPFSVTLSEPLQPV